MRFFRFFLFLHFLQFNVLKLEFISVSLVTKLFKCLCRGHAENVLREHFAEFYDLREKGPQTVQVSLKELWVVLDAREEDIHWELVNDVRVRQGPHVHVVQVHQGVCKMFSQVLWL